MSHDITCRTRSHTLNQHLVDVAISVSNGADVLCEAPTVSVLSFPKIANHIPKITSFHANSFSVETASEMSV